MPSIRRGPGNHWESIDEHFEKQTLLQGLSSVSTPTLFLAGTKSPVPNEQSLGSAELMREAQVVLPLTGHFPWLERPTEIVDPVAAFLRKT